MQQRSYNIGQEFTAACHLLDVEAEPILKRLGLPKPAMNGTGLYVSALQLARLFECLVVEYGQDDVHLRLADGFAKGAFGHALLALHCSDTLRTGIHRVAHFKSFLEPVHWQISESDTGFGIRLRSLSTDFPLDGIGQITSFLCLVKTCRNVTAKYLVPERLCLTDAVPYQAQIEEELGCPIELGQDAYLELPQTAMDNRILSVNRYVTSGLDARAIQDRIDVKDDAYLVAAVVDIVLELLPSGEVTLTRVADRLAISKRTLERRLAKQDCRFVDLVRDSRRDMASHYLRQTALSTTEISLLLGYQEINSFYRAFKDWHGCAPQEYRRVSQQTGDLMLSSSFTD